MSTKTTTTTEVEIDDVTPITVKKSTDLVSTNAHSIEPQPLEEMLVTKKEYAIVGDKFFVSFGNEDAPSWLTTLVNGIVDAAVTAGLTDYDLLVQDVINAIASIDVAANTFVEQIKFDNLVNGIIGTRLSTLNATNDGKYSTILNLEIVRVDADSALTLKASQIVASYSADITAQITSVQTAYTTADVALSNSIDALNTAFTDQETSLSGTASAVSGLQTYVGLTGSSFPNGTGMLSRVSLLEKQTDGLIEYVTGIYDVMLGIEDPNTDITNDELIQDALPYVLWTGLAGTGVPIATTRTYMDYSLTIPASAQIGILENTFYTRSDFTDVDVDKYYVYSSGVWAAVTESIFTRDEQAERAAHTGDVYVHYSENSSGIKTYIKGYKFIKTIADSTSPYSNDSEGYGWAVIVDTDAQAVYIAVLNAKGAADGKISLFYAWGDGTGGIAPADYVIVTKEAEYQLDDNGDYVKAGGDTTVTPEIDGVELVAEVSETIYGNNVSYWFTDDGFGTLKLYKQGTNWVDKVEVPTTSGSASYISVGDVLDVFNPTTGDTTTYSYNGTSWQTTGPTGIVSKSKWFIDLDNAVYHPHGQLASSQNDLRITSKAYADLGKLSVEAQFAYSSTIILGGKIYSSGFGLDSLGTVSIGTDGDGNPIFDSVFRVNAERFILTNPAFPGVEAAFAITAAGLLLSLDQTVATRNEPKGDHIQANTYDTGDIVSDNGSSYMAVQNIPSGIAIGNTTYWQLLAAIGYSGAGSNYWFKRSTIVPTDAPASSGADANGWYDDLNDSNLSGAGDLYTIKGTKAEGSTSWTFGSPVVNNNQIIRELVIYSAPSTGTASKPTSSTYNFSTDVLTIGTNSNSWSKSLVSITAKNQKIYATTALVKGNDTQIAVVVLWSTAVIYAQRVDGVTPDALTVNAITADGITTLTFSDGTIAIVNDGTSPDASGIIIIYADDAEGTNTSFTQGVYKYANYYEWTGTAPGTVPAGLTYTLFIGVDGDNAGVIAIYSNDAAGTTTSFTFSNQTFINFYEWIGTAPTVVPAGLTYVKFVGDTGPSGSFINYLFTRKASTPFNPGGTDTWYSSVTGVPSGAGNLWSINEKTPIGGGTVTYSDKKVIDDPIVRELTIYSDVGTGAKTKPTNGVSKYDFTDNTLTINDALWNKTIPSITAVNQKVYVTTALATGNSTQTSVSVTWNTAVIYSQRIDGITPDALTVSAITLDGVTTLTFSDGTITTIDDGTDNGVRIIYSAEGGTDTSGTFNTSFTQGSRKYVNYYEWTVTAPGTVPNGLVYTLFIGVDGDNAGVIPIYHTDTSGTGSFTQGSRGFVNFYEWTGTPPSSVPAGLTYVRFIGIDYTGTIEYYLLNNSSTAPADGGDNGTGWSTSATSLSPTSTNKYLWNYNVSSRSVGNPFKGSVSLIAQYSADGDPGNSITSVVETYQLGTSSTVYPTGSWITEFNTLDPITVSLPYIWNKTVINYSSIPSTTTITLIAAKGDIGASAPWVTLTANKITFAVDSSGNLKSGESSSITLTSTSGGFEAPEPTAEGWQVSDGTIANFDTTTDSNTRVVSFSNLTTNSATIRSLIYHGSTYQSNPITISKVYDGAKGAPADPVIYIYATTENGTYTTGLAAGDKWAKISVNNGSTYSAAFKIVGDNAPSVIFQYSPTENGTYTTGFAAGTDFWAKNSTDGGSTFGTAYRLVGTNGDPADSMIILYSATQNGTYGTTFTSGTHFWAKTSVNGGSTYTAAYRIVGIAGVSVLMSNQSTNIPCYSNGVPKEGTGPYAGTGATFTVTEGGVPLVNTVTTAAGYWYIQTNSVSSIARGAITVSGTTAGSTTANATSITADTASITWKIRVNPSDGSSSYLVELVQSFSKNYDGGAGSRGTALATYSVNITTAPGNVSSATIAGYWNNAVSAIYDAEIAGDTIVVTNIHATLGWTHIYEYTGSAWSASSVFTVNGNQIVTGTIYGNALVVGAVIRSPKIEFIGSTHTRVSSANGFGSADQFIEWFGVHQGAGGTVDYSLLTEANAITYLKTDGSAYFGGSISAGILKTAGQTSNVLSNATITIGRFGSNAGLITIVYSYTWDWQANSVSSSGYTAGPISCNLILERIVGNGSTYSTIATIVANGSITYDGYEPEISKYLWYGSISSSWTYTDNLQSASDRTYRLRITSRSTPSVTNPDSQNLTVIATE